MRYIAASRVIGELNLSALEQVGCVAPDLNVHCIAEACMARLRIKLDLIAILWCLECR